MKRTTLAALFIVSAIPATGCQTAPAATVDHGQELYGNYCQQCHQADAVGWQEVGAPSIAGLPEWYILEQLGKFQKGIRGAHHDDAEGQRMRPLSRTVDDEIDSRAVAMYISSLPPHPPAATVQGDAAKGAQLFATCSACHGPEGKGNEQLGAPSLLVQPDWYLVRQLGKFKAGIRGAHPQDTRGQQMRPMAMTLADDQAVHDVIAHVNTLRK